MKICALPQPLTGDEIVTILQQQNGEWIKCSMPLSTLASFLIQGWIKTLPTDRPATTGIAWNNTGVVSIS